MAYNGQVQDALFPVASINCSDVPCFIFFCASEKYAKKHTIIYKIMWKIFA